MFQNFKRILEQKKGHECIQNTTKVNADASYTVHETYFLQLRPNHNNIMLRTDASRIQKKNFRSPKLCYLSVILFLQTSLLIRTGIAASSPESIRLYLAPHFSFLPLIASLLLFHNNPEETFEFLIASENIKRTEKRRESRDDFVGEGGVKGNPNRSTD